MATVLEEDLLDDNSFKEYGDDLEDLDADAEEALLGIGSDDETQGNEGYEGHEDTAGEEVEYVDEEGNPVEINEGDEVEFVEYTDAGHETEAYEAGGSSIAEDVLDLVVDADLEFDDSVVQEDVKYEPPQKKPRLPVSSRLGSHPVQNVELPKQGEGHHEHVEHVEAEEEQSQNADPIDENDEIADSVSESEDEEEDEEEEDEASGRGRFHSERPNIIQLSAAKKRTNIPDTLDGIIQSSDSFRSDSFRDKRNRPNWEHSRQEQHQQQQQQQYRNRDYRNRGDKERNTWSSHGNKSASQPVHVSSKLDQSSASKSSNNNQQSNSSAPPSVASQSSLLGQPPNLLVRDMPPRDTKEPQAPRKILINPHFKGSINSSAPSAARVAGSSTWVDQSIQPAGRTAPLLETAPSFQQAQLANYTGSTIHQQHPAELSQSLMPEQRQQQQHHSFQQFNPTQPAHRPPLASAHYSELPVSSFQQHNSRIGAPPYSTPNSVPSSLSSVPLPHQYPPVDICMPLQQQHQMHHQNDPWHQNVPLPPTHVQPEIQRGVWNNPPLSVHQFPVASVQNTVPQRWPPPQQSQTINQSSYNNPMELHHHHHQQLPHQLPAVSLPDMRLPPPNFNGPRMATQQNITPWQGQNPRSKHHLHGSPLSVPRFSHPPPPLLASVPPNPRFLVRATSRLKQLAPRMPFNNNIVNANILRQRNAGFSRGLLPQPSNLWLQTPTPMSGGQNVQTPFPRKRPLNPGVGLLGRVTKGHQQVVSRRQFQVISNIKEVQLVDTLPLPSPLPVASPVKIQPKQEAMSAIAADHEDEETRQYRQQIELQKKKREEIMRIKEQRRQLMALQRRKLLIEQQKAEANAGNDGNGPVNFQPVVVPQKAAVVSKVKAASVSQTSQQSPILLRATGQPIMSLVSRNKKQVVVRRVSPLLTGHVTSPTFLIQHPGFMQQQQMISQPRPTARVFLTKPPNAMSQVAPRHALMQRVMPVKQMVAQLTGMPAVAMASTSKVKPMSQQPTSGGVGTPARRVVRNAAGVSQTTPSSPNIISKKFPVQAMNADPKKNVQQQQKQKQMAAIKQNTQQRAVTVGQQAKRTVVMNSADAKLVQPKQQPVAAVVGQQTQRRVMAAKAVSARVQIDNLALSTSEAVVHKLCQNVGPVENVVLHRDKRTAVVTFRNQQHAHEFMSKYQRRMLDLSLINISMLT